MSFLISILISPERIAQNSGVFLNNVNIMECIPFNCLEIKDFVLVLVFLKLIDEIFKYFNMAIVRGIMKHSPEVASL